MSNDTKNPSGASTESSPRFYPAENTSSCCSDKAKDSQESCCCSKEGQNGCGCGCESKCPCACGSALGAFVLRLSVGLITLVNGLTKFIGTKTSFVSDGEYGEREVIEKVFGPSAYSANMETYRNLFSGIFPDFLLNLFLAVLGYALVLLGVTLILGLFKKTSLMLTAFLYMALMFGLLMIKQEAGVCYLAVYLAMIAGALVLTKKDRIAVCKCF